MTETIHRGLFRCVCCDADTFSPQVDVNGRHWCHVCWRECPHPTSYVIQEWP